MSPKPGNSNTKWKIIAVTIAIVAILINLASLIFVTTKSLNMESNTSSQTTSSNSICLPCEALTKYISGDHSKALFQTLTKRPDGGIERCCAGNTEQISALFQLLEQKPKLDPQAVYIPEHSDLSHVSALKRVLPPSSEDGSLHFLSNSLVSLNFSDTHNDPLTEHAQNIEVLPSGFVIQYPGMYFVYSSVHFGPNSNKPCEDFEFQTWTHTVTRTRPNERQSSGVILTSLHTCCDDCKKDKETSYAAGVFSLEAGDHLHAEVSAHGLIRFQKESSFLGLTMLGGQDDITSH